MSKKKHKSKGVVDILAPSPGMKPGSKEWEAEQDKKFHEFNDKFAKAFRDGLNEDAAEHGFGHKTDED